MNIKLPNVNDHFHHSFSKFLSSSDLIQDSAHCRPCARKYSRSIHQQASAKTSRRKTGKQGFSNSRTKQDGIPQGPDGFWRCHDTHDTIHSEPMQVDLPCDVPSPLRCVLVRATLWVMCQQLRCQQRSSRIGVDQPWVAVKINHKNPGFCFNWPKWWTVGQTSKKESTKRKLALIRTCYKVFMPRKSTLSAYYESWSAADFLPTGPVLQSLVERDRITEQESSMLLPPVFEVCFIYHMSPLKNEKQRPSPSLLTVRKFLPSFQLCTATPSTPVLRRWFTLWAALDRLLAWLKHVYSTWSTTLWSSQVHPVSTSEILNLMSLTGKWTELEDSKWRKGRKWTKVDSAQVVFSSLGFHDTLPGFFLLSLKSARHRL